MLQTEPNGSRISPQRPVDRIAVWRQTAIITLIAVAAFVGVRLLPEPGSLLHSQDFHAGGKTFLEFCAPGSPQFAPVDRVRSPVTLEIVPDQTPIAGAVVDCSLRMTTASGKPVTMNDLFVVHTEKLHLLVIDSGLDDYQHLHPSGGEASGEFRFSFRPRHAGTYRMFADFMPRATGRSLYAAAAVEVMEAATPLPLEPHVRSVDTAERLQSSSGGLRFTLVPSASPVRIYEPTDLVLKIRRDDHAPLVLEEIMGAAAHMVAFDAGVSGFAHLHPTVEKPGVASQTPVGEPVGEATLKFALQLTDPGYYRIWAQIKVGGEEVFAPFGIRVEP